MFDYHLPSAQMNIFLLKVPEKIVNCAPEETDCKCVGFTFTLLMRFLTSLVINIS